MFMSPKRSFLLGEGGGGLGVHRDLAFSTSFLRDNESPSHLPATSQHCLRVCDQQGPTPSAVDDNACARERDAMGSGRVDTERLGLLLRLGLPDEPLESTAQGVWVPTLATSNGRAHPTARTELDRGCHDIFGAAKVKGDASVSRVLPIQFFAGGGDQRERSGENRGHGSVSSPNFQKIAREKLFGKEHSHDDAANSQSWTKKMLAKAQFIASVDRLTLQKVRPPDEEREAEVHTFSQVLYIVTSLEYTRALTFETFYRRPWRVNSTPSSMRWRRRR